MFQVGQKVVCVRDDWNHPLLDQLRATPVRYHAYTIRGFTKETICGTELVGIWLEEIINPPISAGDQFREPSFWIENFRPIVERKTDIAIFTKILDDVRSKEPIREDA